MNNQHFSKLAEFLKKEMPQVLRSSAVRIGNDEYMLFGNYQVGVNTRGYFTVVNNRTETEIEFSTLKHAVAWCTMHDTGKYKEAARIEHIDMRLSSTEVSITLHKNISKNLKLKTEAYIINSIKLQEAIRDKKSMIDELQTLISTSKHLQLYRFSEKESKFATVR